MCICKEKKKQKPKMLKTVNCTKTMPLSLTETNVKLKRRVPTQTKILF